MPRTTSPGSSGPTSKDVARIAGVSQSTVSYVMSGKRPISAKTRKLVEDAIAQLTYEPHAGARALAGQRTSVIAVVVPFATPLSAHGLMSFVEEIALVARAHDHDVLLVTADEGIAGLRRVAGRRLCDAVVVMEVRTDDDRVAVARDLGVPVLFIGVPDDAQGLHCNDFDFESAADLLVGELAAAGERDVVVLAWGDDTTSRDINYVPRFERGARRSAQRHGVALEWAPVPADRVLDPLLEDVLAGRGAPPAFVVTTALPEAVGALARRGLRPGTDLSLVALSTAAEAQAQAVAVTGCSTHPRDVSRRAVTRLFRLLDGAGAPPGVELFPAEVTRRDSVRPRP
ncbi:LacI family DNA-binding transcriptional regulator [Kineococcus sp. SYSU DK004]|uniref:LacI family DNA-binding transcriptional regulator n=1 Tax=Kineococcus sp. SYSU DK004 TaxID=3383125 RepID=UPI003D7E323F